MFARWIVRKQVFKFYTRKYRLHCNLCIVCGFGVSVPIRTFTKFQKYDFLYLLWLIWLYFWNPFQNSSNLNLLVFESLLTRVWISSWDNNLRVSKAFPGRPNRSAISRAFEYCFVWIIFCIFWRLSASSIIFWSVMRSCQL